MGKILFSVFELSIFTHQNKKIGWNFKNEQKSTKTDINSETKSQYPFLIYQNNMKQLNILTL